LPAWDIIHGIFCESRIMAAGYRPMFTMVEKIEKKG
jgi:hypothetical protein